MRRRGGGDSVWPWFAASFVILGVLALVFGAWDRVAGWLAVLGVLLCVAGLAARHLRTAGAAAALLGGAALVAVWQGGSWRWFILPAIGVVCWFVVQGALLGVGLLLDRRTWRKRRERRGPLPAFAVPDEVWRGDADLLVTVARADDGEGVPLRDVIAACDYFLRAIPDREEIEHAVRLLAAGGLVEPRGDRIAISETGRRVYAAIHDDDFYEIAANIQDVLDQHRDPNTSLEEWWLPPDVWDRAKDEYVFGIADAR